MHTVFRPTASFALLLKLVLAPANRGVEPSGRRVAFGTYGARGSESRITHHSLC